MIDKICPNCDSEQHEWHVSARGPNDVQDGRIRMSEVSVIAYLSCEECGETLAIIQEDQINNMLNAGA